MNNESEKNLQSNGRTSDTTSTRKSIAIFLSTTVFGALLGTAVSSWWQGASPSIHASSISLTADAADDTEVPVPVGYEQLLLSSSWSTIGAVRGNKEVPLSALLDNFSSNRDKMMLFLSSIARLEGSLPRLRALAERSDALTPSEANEFFEVWEQNDGIIYGSLRGTVRRGAFDVPDSGDPVTCVRPEFRVVREDTPLGNIYIVQRRGGTFASSLLPESQRDLATNRFAAFALACLHGPSLLSIINLVTAESNERSTAERIVSEIDKYRAQYSRIMLQVFVHNGGDESFVMLPDAVLEVHTRGMLNPDGDSIKENHEIQVVANEGKAIEVGPGAATLVVFTSPERLHEFSGSTAVLAALESGAVDSTVRTRVLRGDFANRSVEADIESTRRLLLKADIAADG
ncbi:hypothetical protein DF3PB_710008 [uncultured Defluviicoccus sp.]|uniref:Uncharacterized protein n=1 Tax=metagenome TaxID=256318 RepID=A0A380TJL6_9ZZZZ|nr:hypothetical protein DF3PB_710008 [uncultured Defluviicoccus sp.]